MRAAARRARRRRWATRRRPGAPALRDAAAALDRAPVRRRRSTPTHVGACVGTKELVASLPHLLRLRNPRRDTVLYPAVAYPSYEMGATLAGLPRGAGPARRRVAPRPRRDRRRRRRARARAVGQRARQPDVVGRRRRALRARSRRGHAARGIVVASDECYAEFAPRARDDPRAPGSTACSRCTACRSARTSRACGSASTPATPSSSTYLVETRKHAGLMAPTPMQAAAVAALGDDAHVDVQRARYAERRDARARRARAARPRARRRPVPLLPLAARTTTAPTTAGRSRRGSRTRPACSSRPAISTAPAGADHVRLALVQPHDRFELALDRLATASSVNPTRSSSGRPREADHAAVGSGRRLARRHAASPRRTTRCAR